MSGLVVACVLPCDAHAVDVVLHEGGDAMGGAPDVEEDRAGGEGECDGRAVEPFLLTGGRGLRQGWDGFAAVAAARDGR